MKLRLRRVTGTSVFKYGVASVVPRATAIATAIVIAPLGVQQLGATQYGFWVMATQIPSVVISPDFGLGQGVVTKFAETHQKEGSLQSKRQDIRALTRTLSLISAVWLILGIGAGALYAFTAGNGDGAVDLFVALVVGLACFTAGIPPAIWNQIRLSQEQGHTALLWEGGGKLATLLCCLSVLLMFPSLPLLVVAYLLPSTLALWAHGTSASRSLARGASTIEPRMHTKRALALSSPYFKIGKHFVMMQLAYVLATAGDPYLINAVTGVEDVTYVNILRRPYELLPLITSILSIGLWPVYVRLRRAGSAERLRRVVSITVAVGMATTIGGGTAVFLLRTPIYAYLGSGQVLPHAWDLLWLTFQFSCSAAVAILATFLNSSLAHAKVSMVMLLSAPMILVSKYVALTQQGVHAYFAAGSVAYFISVLLPIATITLLLVRRGVTDESDSSGGAVGLRD